jgi:hypothetical protein
MRAFGRTHARLRFETEERMLPEATIRADRHPKGGRPCVGYTSVIGTVPARSFLRVDKLFRDANMRLMAEATCARCDKTGKVCGIRIVCRLRDILSGYTKSCKCLRPVQYLINVSAQAEKIPWSHLGEI